MRNQIYNNEKTNKNENYVMTLDNFRKIIEIYYRICSNIPTILINY